MVYLHERRKALGGYLPQRRQKADEKLTVPALASFKDVLDANRRKAAKSRPPRRMCA